MNNMSYWGGVLPYIRRKEDRHTNYLFSDKTSERRSEA